MKLTRPSRRAHVLVVAALGMLGVTTSGCAVGRDDPNDSKPADALEDASASRDVEYLDGGSEVTFDVGGMDGAADVGSDGGAACVATAVSAEQVPLDMLILLDASASMLDSVVPQKWPTVVDALTTFFGDPASKGISAALTIFPAGDAKAKCTATTYQTPQIDYGVLPARKGALVTAMGGTDPKLNDITPLHSVAEGALAGAVDWKKAHAGHVVVAVLATDGKSTCVTTVEPTTSAASALAHGVQTFTVGMKGADLAQLDAIAAAGGTKKAYDATDIALFEKQLNAIRASVLPCEVMIPAAPPGQTFDRGKVNVQYTPSGGGAVETLPYVASAASCGPGKGWYYDDDAAPTKVVYCPATCKEIQADARATVDVAFGCKTVIR